VKIPQILCALVVGAATALPLGAQARPDTSHATQLPSVELPPDLARVLTDYETEWRRGGAAVAQLFTEDGYVLSGGRPPIKGRAAIAEHYGSGGGGPLSLRAIAYAAEGSVGYIIGGYTTERGTPDIGKFTLTLRKRPDGRWMIVSDMDNPNRRPRSP
jgi:ketosteroid isomerase-like protein